jgi:ferredoxin-NADP reductase
MFATGSGISPVKAVIESGALEGRRARLYWGTKSPGEF